MLQQLLEFVFPPQCGGCEKAGTGACERCLPRNALEIVRLESFEAVGLGRYESGLRRAVLALKSGRRDVARAFALRLGEIVRPGEMLVPVPTTAARRRERGFDGCELMAQCIAHARVALGLKQVAGDRQRGRKRAERLAARGRFAWSGEPLHGCTVSLLDDVLTTGATLEDCANALRAAGARVERALVVAVAL